MVDRWTEVTTERERVESIARTLTEPQSAEWVADRAEVELETAKEHLEILTEYGVLLITDNGEYIPDPTWLYFEQLRELIISNSKAELRSELEAIEDAINGWETRYNVESRDGLEASFSDDLDPEEIRERKWVIRHWGSTLNSREMIQTALMLYDEVRSLAENTPGTTLVKEEND